jgi:hypothetical protein
MGWFMRQVEHCFSNELSSHGERFILFQCPVCGGNGSLPNIGNTKCGFCQGRGTSDPAVTIFIADPVFEKISSTYDELLHYKNRRYEAEIQSCLIEMRDILVIENVYSLSSKGWNVEAINDRVTCRIDRLNRYHMRAGRLVETVGGDVLLMSMSQRDIFLEDEKKVTRPNNI